MQRLLVGCIPRVSKFAVVSQFTQKLVYFTTFDAERNYECMGVRCADVGGIYDGGNQRYLERPCSSGSSLGVQVALLITAAAGAVSLFL